MSLRTLLLVLIVLCFVAALLTATGSTILNAGWRTWIAAGGLGFALDKFCGGYEPYTVDRRHRVG
jgi:lipoprotein signal peptidase